MCSKRRQRAHETMRDIGRTEVTQTQAIVLIVGFFGLVLSVPVAQHVYELREIVSGRASGRSLPQCYDVFATLPYPSREELKQFEDTLEEEAIVRQWLQPATQTVLADWFGAGSHQVYLGRSGWLFYSDDVKYVLAPPFIAPARHRSPNDMRNRRQTDPLAAIVKFREDLSARGIELLVLPTPVKPVIYPDALSVRCVGQRQPLHNRGYRSFLEELRDYGVPVCDVSTTLMSVRQSTDDLLFLPKDTHWTPTGMQLAVRKLVEWIDRSRIELPHRNTVSYRCRTELVQGRGDLEQMLGMSLGSDERSQRKVLIRQVEEASGTPWKPDPTADILVLGDSFSNIYSDPSLGWGAHAGLVPQLSLALKQPIDCIIRNGDGAFATRQQLQSKLLRAKRMQQAGVQVHDRLANKRLVIFQFAVRELVNGDWKVLELPKFRQLESDRTTSSDRHDTEFVIQGFLQDRARVPRPGSVPYRDVITSLHLKNVTLVRGDQSAWGDVHEVVVFTWGMHKNRWTQIMNAQLGTRITLRVVLWRDVEDRYGQFARIELDDPNFLLIDLPIVWAGEP